MINITETDDLPVSISVFSGNVKRVLVTGCCLAVLVASPAAAQGKDETGLGTGVGVSWSKERAARISRAAAFDPVGTTRSPREAVAYLLRLAEQKTGGYWGQCLKLADDAYMPKGPRLGDAFAQWHRAKDAGVAYPKDEYPPLGAQMFWDPGHAAGHVATYVGDGKAVTNMPDGTVKAIEWRRMNHWGPYLGWADPYYK
mgnify:CR=1 FL=1